MRRPPLRIFHRRTPAKNIEKDENLVVTGKTMDVVDFKAERGGGRLQGQSQERRWKTPLKRLSFA
ncbi:MAG: hypothetical protein B6D35_08920 [Candidatus Brocadia sp. UTAMX2]|nr:MAG: hypothetical protein B6D35_08920 [Candidatus Brocadia sp. UTAMX2]